MTARAPRLPSTMRRDLIAIYAAQAWIAIMGVAFVPVYIRYLGIEAYGVIGLFATLQAMLVILDLGMTPTLTREIARFTGGERDAAGVRDLLRSVEIVAAGIGLLAAILIWTGSSWLANSWFQAQAISENELARVLSIMGMVAALRFVEGIFRGAILGLHRQALYNGIAAIMATLRGVGAIVVLANVSRTLDAFFIWQGIISVATLAALAIATYSALPQSDRRARFSLDALKSIGRFAAGMLGISLLALALTQIDKILLSRLLSLTALGYYMLATVAAAALEMLVAPLFQAVTPRLSRLHASGDEAGFVALYHAGSQLVTVTAGAAGLVLIGFPERIMFAWTSDPVLSAEVAPFLRWLALGYMLNVMMWMPYQAQLAYRWTGLALRINLVAVLVLVPALLWAVPRYGAISAAAVWVLLNAAYVLIGVHLMHRKILKTEKWRWYGQDLALPLASAGGAVLVLHWLVERIGPISGKLAEIAVLAGISAVTLIAAILGAPIVRAHGLRMLRRTAA